MTTAQNHQGVRLLVQYEHSQMVRCNSTYDDCIKELDMFPG